MSNKSSCFSPADKVGSSDDLLSEILLRLPVRSVLRFKSVSKHHNFLISSPSFRLLHSTRNPNPPPTGLFVSLKTKRKRNLEFEFISFDIKIPVKAIFVKPSFDLDVRNMIKEHSCNGLVLYSSKINNTTRECYIYNPTVNQITKLPTFDNFDYLDEGRGMAIAFNPAKSPHYRIIYAYHIENGYQVAIYSSESRTCKPSRAFALYEVKNMDIGRSVYWNNSIHWFNPWGIVFYFNLDNETVHHIKTPFGESLGYIFKSQDNLLLVEIDVCNFIDDTIGFSIHELKSDYSDWSKKCSVYSFEVGRSFTEFLSSHKSEIVVLSVVLGEKEDDSFMVMKIGSKVGRLNLVSKTVYELHDVNLSHGKYRRSHVFPFVESLYNV